MNEDTANVQQNWEALLASADFTEVEEAVATITAEQLRDEWLEQQKVENPALAGFIADQEQKPVPEWDRFALLKTAGGSRLKTIEHAGVRVQEQALIPGHILSRGLLQIVGEPYTSKSTLAVDLACTVAAGLPEWLGLPTNMTEPGDVVYVALEGGQPFWDMLVAWQTAHPEADISGLRVLDGDEGDYVYIPATTKPEDVPEYQESFRRLQDEIEQGEVRPRMVVFDTQIDLSPGIDENSAKEISVVFGELSKWAKEMRMIVALIHHANRSGTYRGSSAQFGKADMQIMITVDDDQQKHMKFHKVKGQVKPEQPYDFYSDNVWLKDGGAGPVIVMGTKPGSVKDSDMHADHKARIAEFCKEPQAKSAIAKHIGMTPNASLPGKLLSELVKDGVIELSEVGARTYYQTVPITVKE